MRLFNNAVDRFCANHRRFGIPRLMLIIIIISAITLFISPGVAYNYMAFHPTLILRGQVWRLVTWIFLGNSITDISDIIFTAITFYFYYFIGSTLEREWGTGRFTIYYIFGVLLHIIYGFISYYILGGFILITPMYLNLSMFFAFAVLFPDFTVRLFLLIPIKIKWLALINALFFAYSIISALLPPDISLVRALLPVVSLLNFFLMCGNELITFLRPARARANPRVVKFKSEARRVRKEMKNMPYRHICAVCGKTDTDNPQEDFRYCSICSGYHCFCSEHINNHVHFTE